MHLLGPRVLGLYFVTSLCYGLIYLFLSIELKIQNNNILLILYYKTTSNLQPGLACGLSCVLLSDNKSRS